jgi:hypothetical protein
MGRFYENGNKPSGSIRAGNLLTSLASLEGVCWVELVICTDVVSKTLPLQADCSVMVATFTDAKQKCVRKRIQGATERVDTTLKYFRARGSILGASN